VPYCGDTYERPPEDLPCGACTSGAQCQMNVIPLCDCDGAGGQAPFLHEPPGGLWDGWRCLCEGGTWHCYLESQSGSSCFMVCPDEGG